MFTGELRKHTASFFGDSQLGTKVRFAALPRDSFDGFVRIHLDNTVKFSTEVFANRGRLAFHNELLINMSPL